MRLPAEFTRSVRYFLNLTIKFQPSKHKFSHYTQSLTLANDASQMSRQSTAGDMCTPVNFLHDNCQGINKASKEHTRRIVLNPDVLNKYPANYVPLKRAKLKNCALLLSYCGRNYYGMQLTRSCYSIICPTIEAKLFTALIKANLLGPNGSVSPKSYVYNRGSRTDKSVSAVRQVVSLLLPSHIPEDELIQMVNKHLPQDIRVFGARRVTKDFNPRFCCFSRGYSYLCPSFAFAPVDQVSNLHYRITPEEIDNINHLMKQFVGRHNFCNFTSKKYFRDRSCERSVTSLKIEEAFHRMNMEWLRIQVQGESFMLHQIRKMIGLSIAITKGYIAKDMISLAWEQGKINIPRAPGLGLVLENQCFQHYNNRASHKDHNKVLEFNNSEEEILSFREKHIDPVIMQEEINSGSMLNWLYQLPLFEYVQVPEEHSDQCIVRSKVGMIHKYLVDEKEKLNAL